MLFRRPCLLGLLYLLITAAQAAPPAGAAPQRIAWSQASADDFSRAFVFADIKLHDQGRMLAVKTPVGLWGLLDRDGRWIVPARYQHIDSFVGSIAAVVMKKREDSLWGLIDRRGTVLIEPRFKALHPQKNGRSVAQTADSIGLVDLHGNWLARFPKPGNLSGNMATFSARHSYFSGEVAILCTGVLCGLIDKNGKWRIAPHYPEIRHAGNGYALHESRDEVAAFVDADGKLLFRPAEQFLKNVASGRVESDGLVFVQSYDEEGIYGFVDSSGRWLIQRGREGRNDYSEGRLTYLGQRMVFDARLGEILDLGDKPVGKGFQTVAPFRDGVARAETKDGIGVINTRLEWVLPPQKAGEVLILDGGRFLVHDAFGRRIGATTEAPLPTRKREGCLYGLADAQGNWRVPPRYTHVAPLVSGGSIASLIGQAVLLDAQGKTLTTPPDPRPRISNDDPRNGKFGFIEPGGHMRIGPGLWEADEFREGLAGIGGGFVDRDGYWAIPPIFSQTRAFSEGWAAVLIGGEGWNYIDRNCRMLSAARYESAEDFQGGVARVFDKHSRPAYIDRQGRPVAMPVYPANAGDSPQPLALNGRWGYADARGNWLIEPRFEDAEPFSDGLAAVKSGRRWGFIDRSGKLVIAALYTDTRPMQQGWAAVEIAPTQDNTVTEWRMLNGNGRLSDNAFEVAPGEFVNGLAPARANGRWGYIHKDGRWQIEPRFEMAKPFRDGLALVSLPNSGGPAANTPPAPAQPLRPRRIESLDKDLLKVSSQDGKLFALLDPQGRLILPAQ